VAYDSKGNGLAVWRAKDAANQEQILTSHYATAAGKWGAATVLPGSLSKITGADNERGAPALAMDGNGNAIALWVSEAGAGKSSLMSSHFSYLTGWADPVSISGALVVEPVFDHPGLAFDGKTFVAAFAAQQSANVYTYTVRYDVQGDSWGTFEKRQADADAVSILRMPRLAADAHGNALLVWATGTAPTFKLFTQRYAHGAWSSTTTVPGGQVDSKYFETSREFPLSLSASGLGALAWGLYTNDNFLVAIRLASFY
jgi:hypothetical protein